MSHVVKLSVRATAVAVALMSGAAFAAPAFDANVELDNTFRSGSATKGTSDEGLTQGGRVEMNVTSKMGADLFAAAKAALILKKDGSVGTDDMWVQVGSSFADVKLGRFEAADMFPLQQDTVVNDAAPIYKMNALRGRIGSNVFQAMPTVNLGGGLSIEMNIVQSNFNGVGNAGARGVRPVISYAGGPLTAKLGFESGELVANGVTGPKIEGFGAVIGYDLGGINLIGNFASGKSSGIKSDGLGLSVKAGGLAVGVANGKTDGTPNVTTFYASYSIPFFDVKGASITPAFSTSKVDGGADDNSFRVRLNYAF